MRLTKYIAAVCMCGLLAACQTSSTLPQGTPKAVKIGKPYSVAGKMYYPQYDPHYDERGIASWYGPGFHGKKTANGEIYDQHALTAAHKTLPMPSLVQVTNLNTGKKITVRITDRGPFKAGRIIDLSQGAAEALDIKGLAKVRVEYLKDETEQLWASMNIRPKNIAFAKNDRAKPSNSEIEQASMAYDSQYQDVVIDPSEISSAAPIMTVSSSNVSDVNSAPQAPLIPIKSSGFGFISNAEAATRPNDTPFGAPSKPLQNQPSQPAPDENNDQAFARILSNEEEGTEHIKQATMNSASIPPRALDPPAIKTGVYMVQAGAFSSSQNADSLASRVRSLGSVSVENVPRGAAQLYRVRLGPYASKLEAEQRLHDLFNMGIKDAQLVATP